MNKTTYLYLTALLYGCVLDVYAASAVRLVSGTAHLGITRRWLTAWRLRGVIERRSWGREYLELLDSRTVAFPVVELFTGLCLTAIIARHGPTVEALALTVVLTTLAIGAAVDLESLIYPNRLSLPLIGVGVAFAVLEGFMVGPAAAFDRIGGGAVAFGVMWGFAESYYRFRGTEGLGQGDVKMCTAVGLFVGIKGFLFFLVAFSVLGSITGVALMAARRARYETALPTGGWYALALACVVLFPSLPDRYLDLYAGGVQPYQQAPLSLETAGRLLNEGFGAGVRDDR